MSVSLPAKLLGGNPVPSLPALGGGACGRPVGRGGDALVEGVSGLIGDPAPSALRGHSEKMAVREPEGASSPGTAPATPGYLSVSPSPRLWGHSGPSRRAKPSSVGFLHAASPQLSQREARDRLYLPQRPRRHVTSVAKARDRRDRASPAPDSVEVGVYRRRRVENGFCRADRGSPCWTQG